MRQLRTIFALILAMVVLAACGSPSSGTDRRAGAPSVSPTSAASPTPSVQPTKAPRPYTLPGSQYVYTFTKDATEAQFNDTYKGVWNPYDQGEGGGKYFQTVSAHDGVMDIRLPGGTYKPGDPIDGVAGWFGPKFLPPGADYSITMKVVGGAGYGQAMMMWPSDDVWTNGEKDWPEGQFIQNPAAYDHVAGANCLNGCQDRSFSLHTSADWLQWHTYILTTSSKGQNYYLDGVNVSGQIGRDQVKGPHRVTLQVGATDDTAQPGHILIKEVKIRR